LAVDDTAGPRNDDVNAWTVTRELMHAELTAVAAEHVAAVPAARESPGQYRRGCEVAFRNR
jgi:hypothetical protein